MASERPALPPAQRLVLRLTGTIALLAFLLPTAYVVHYFVWDAPRARVRASLMANAPSPAARRALLEPLTPDNLLLQEQAAKSDADPSLRRAAVTALGANLRMPGLSWRYPLEAGVAKAALADCATHDPDLSVRKAASLELSRVAQAGGAVIRR